MHREGAPRTRSPIARIAEVMGFGSNASTRCERALVFWPMVNNLSVVLGLCSLLAVPFSILGAIGLRVSLAWCIAPIITTTMIWLGVRIAKARQQQLIQIVVALTVVSGLAWGSLASAANENNGASIGFFLSTLVMGAGVFAAPVRSFSIGFGSGVCVTALPLLLTNAGWVPTLFLFFSTLASCALMLSVNTAMIRSERAALRAETLAQQLAIDATTDPLTNLANRRGLLERIDQQLSNPMRKRIGLLLIDLDRFKAVNDTLGHFAGDVVLTTISRRLSAAARRDDLVARFGGDEFAILIGNQAEDETLSGMAERLLDIISEPIDIQGTTVKVTGSIGLIHDPGITSISAAALLQHADVALYDAKGRGRNRISTSTEPQRERGFRRSDDESRLRRAIEEGEIEAWFQPEVDLETGRIIGAEALARWVQGDGQVIPAAKFVPLIQELGLSGALDVAVMRDALITRADWAQRRIVEESFRVHVNADPLAFASPTFASALLDKGLASYGCKPEWIGIEVIESDLLDRFDVSAKNIQTLREHGVTVSLDDFGTGYSTLNLLRALPVDQIKIDRSFVYNISVSDRDLSIARGIIRMAADLGIHVVAEGVETHEHLQVLRDLGCERGQGYLWGAASSAASFESLLIQQPTRTASP